MPRISKEFLPRHLDKYSCEVCRRVLSLEKICRLLLFYFTQVFSPREVK